MGHCPRNPFYISWWRFYFRKRVWFIWVAGKEAVTWNSIFFIWF